MAGGDGVGCGGREPDGAQQIGDQPPLLSADGAIGQGDSAGRLDHALRQRHAQDAVAHAGGVGAVIAEAGTVTGELLPWIAAAEMATDLPLSLMDHRDGEGHAFTAWGPG